MLTHLTSCLGDCVAQWDKEWREGSDNSHADEWTATNFTSLHPVLQHHIQKASCSWQISKQCTHERNKCDVYVFIYRSAFMKLGVSVALDRWPKAFEHTCVLTVKSTGFSLATKLVPYTMTSSYVEVHSCSSVLASISTKCPSHCKTYITGLCMEASTGAQISFLPLQKDALSVTYICTIIIYNLI